MGLINLAGVAWEHTQAISAAIETYKSGGSLEDIAVAFANETDNPNDDAYAREVEETIRDGINAGVAFGVTLVTIANKIDAIGPKTSESLREAAAFISKGMAALAELNQR